MKNLFLFLVVGAAALSAATEDRLEKSMPAGPDGTLVVEVDFGSIEVIGVPDSKEVKVEAWRKVGRSKVEEEQKYLAETPIVFEAEGNRLTLRAKSQKRKGGGWGWFGGRRQDEGRYVIQVPARFNLELDTAGAPVTVTGITGVVEADTSGSALKFSKIVGTLEGDTSGGPISVTDCKGVIEVDTSGGGIEVLGGGGTLEADTSGGGITVRDFEGSVEVDTSGGGLELERIQGELNGNTSGGPIRAVLVSPLAGQVQLETSGGSIEVRLPENTAFALDAATTGGRVRCELPLPEAQPEKNRLTAQFLGGGPLVRLRTSGGNITVRKP